MSYARVAPGKTRTPRHSSRPHRRDRTTPPANGRVPGMAVAGVPSTQRAAALARPTSSQRASTGSAGLAKPPDRNVVIVPMLAASVLVAGESRGPPVLRAEFGEPADRYAQVVGLHRGRGRAVRGRGGARQSRRGVTRDRGPGAVGRGRAGTAWRVRRTPRGRRPCSHRTCASRHGESPREPVD